ncbi:MAG TPA: pilin [Candidatus Saccharimonadales bacterium]|nr:pilin [Candidatus Saccharimonadales bacterium]
MNSAAHYVMHLLATAQALCDPKTQTSCNTGLPTVGVSSNQVHEVLQIVFGIMGAIAVLIIVISGLKFITAQGNPEEISKARQTIIYALVGLAVAISAEAIVSLVLSRL